MLKDILDKFSSKGWALYESNSSDVIQDIVSRGKADSIVLGRTYLTLPAIPKSNDLSEIKNAVQYMNAHALQPIITYGGKSIPVVATRFDTNFVKPLYLLPVEIPYDSFLESLDTLPEFILN